MYPGISINEREDMRVFNRSMDDRSKGFSHSQLNSYMDTVLEGFTEEQKLHIANRILNNYEEKKRATMEQDEADEDEPEL